MLFVDENKKILVASVFGVGKSNIIHKNKPFYDLQLYFLNQTCNYDHIVYLDKENPINFKKSLCIGTTSEQEQEELNGSERHVIGLNKIMEYAKNTSKYDHLLIIDSDAFPFKTGWLKSLIKNIESYTSAAAVRFENLDTFPHPCIHFIKKEHFDSVKFSSGETINILGKSVQDSASNIKNFYPLIRSNYINIHPVLYGIYKDMFYHHGAGSRPAITRGDEYFNTGNIKTIQEKEEYYFEQLISSPMKYINHLRGKNDSV